jgi:hypothetical protein
MILAFLNFLFNSVSDLFSVFAKEKAIVTTNNKINSSKTWVFVVGILEWQDSKNFGSFPKKNRRDVELVNYFKSIGVPTNQIIYLQDKSATTNYIQSSLVNFLKQTQPGDFLFLYYCGHGYNSDEETFFASYDASKNVEGWKVNSIVSSIEQNFRGDKVFLTADCCNSGSLAKAVTEINSKLSYAVLASSDCSETSTGNWTFSDCLLDYFNGEAGADKNNDGQLDLGELASYAQKEMLFGEGQHAQFLTTGKFNSKVALANSNKRADSRIGDYATVKVDGKNYPARIVGVNGSKIKVHYIGYDRTEDEWVDGNRVKINKSVDSDLANKSYKIGENVMVQWQGGWYKATIKDIKANSYLIHYSGYGNKWDEWVTNNRISPLY